MANVDYDNLSREDKNELALWYANQFHISFNKGQPGTQEHLTAELAKQLRQIGSSELINRVNNTFYRKHGKAYNTIFNPFDHNLHSAITREFSGDGETQLHRTLGFAPDYIGQKDLGRSNPEKAKLLSEGRSPTSSNLDLINSDFVPYIGENVKLGSGTPSALKEYIKQTTPVPKEKAPKKPQTSQLPEEWPKISFPQYGMPDPKVRKQVEKNIERNKRSKVTRSPEDNRETVESVNEQMKLEAIKAQRDLQKSQIDRANRLRERRRVLKGGYQGGVDQYDYDQGLLKGNRLGDKFRLRTPEEREARVREGQYNITAPRRRAEANMGATIRGMKQWADDTTGAPKALADPDLSASRKQEIQSNRDAALKQAIRSVSSDFCYSNS